MDPFEKFKSRRAPGAQTIADFLIPTKPKAPAKPPAVTPKEALQLGAYVNKQVEAGARDLKAVVLAYTFPYPPGEGPPGAGAPQKKVLEDLGGLLLPKVYFKALTELGEGRLPLTKRVAGPGVGLGVGEEAEIQRQDERLRAERAAALARLFPLAYGSSSRTPIVAALALSVINGSIQPEHIRPVNAAALANLEAAEGIRRALVHERADP